MEFKIGDKVKIKSWDEICKLGTPILPEGRIEFSNTDDIIFNEHMREFCGKEYIIEDTDIIVHTPIYILTTSSTLLENEDISYWDWLENWLEKVEG